MDNNSVPMLIPYEPNEFWEQVRKIIQEEVSKMKTPEVKIMQTQVQPKSHFIRLLKYASCSRFHEQQFMNG